MQKYVRIILDILLYTSLILAFLLSSLMNDTKTTGTETKNQFVYQQF